MKLINVRIMFISGFGYVLLAAILVFLLTGCANKPEKKGELYDATTLMNMVGPQPGELPVASVYRLQLGDVMDVKFFGNPELNENIIIRPDGKVSLQLIGEVDAIGSTPFEFEARLVDAYSKILHEPKVTVIIRKFTTQKIYVGGEVRVPGMVPLEGRLTAFQAILHAGGFVPGSEEGNVVVLRYNGNQGVELINLNLNSQSIDWWRNPPLAEHCESDQADSDCTERVAPERFAMSDLYLEPLDIVIVPQKRIAQVAEFFDEYISKIVPIYSNMGFSFTYDLRREIQVKNK